MGFTRAIKSRLVTFLSIPARELILKTEMFNKKPENLFSGFLYLIRFDFTVLPVKLRLARFGGESFERYYLEPGPGFPDGSG